MSRKKRISRNDIIAVIEAQPDRRNTECVYFLGGTPSCVIGHVLAATGYTIEDLAAAGVDNADDTVTALPKGWFGVDALHLAVALQQLADSGARWSDLNPEADAHRTWAEALRGALGEA